MPEGNSKGHSTLTVVLTGVGGFALGFAGGYVTRDMQAEQEAAASGTTTTKKPG